MPDHIFLECKNQISGKEVGLKGISDEWLYWMDACREWTAEKAGLFPVAAYK